MAARYRHRSRPIDIWPGFVDALSTLLILIIFVLMVFVVAQFMLGHALTGRTQEIGRLDARLRLLSDQLALEQDTGERLRVDLARVTDELAATTRDLDGARARAADREVLAARVQALEGRLSEAAQAVDAGRETVRVQLEELALLRNDIAALTALKADLEARVQDLGGRLGEQSGALAAERELSKESRAQLALLNERMEALRHELERVNAALEASEATTRGQKTEIASLGQRLNVALANKVEELSRYRSEFFGRLREALGDDPGIRIEGDRFVFQSEVLFDVGEADLGEAGQVELDRLAATLLDLSQRMPTDVNWVLRVDGHTDKVRIATLRFPSNWELSAARALSVVHHLIARGVPAERLAAAGFGEYQPMDPGSDDTARRRNRRIELRFDQR